MALLKSTPCYTITSESSTITTTSGYSSIKLVVLLQSGIFMLCIGYVLDQIIVSALGLIMIISSTIWILYCPKISKPSFKITLHNLDSSNPSHIPLISYEESRHVEITKNVGELTHNVQIAIDELIKSRNARLKKERETREAARKKEACISDIENEVIARLK